MTAMEIQLRKDDLSATQIHERPRAALAPGQARLSVELFALTSNNITYAALGERMRYWDFFPPADGAAQWGLLPVWGFARVVESRAPQVREGERVYGLLPMASDVVLDPVRASADAFFDGAPHRAGLHPAYNRYARCALDPLYAPHTEEVQAVLRPLFITSWLIGDILLEQGRQAARRALVSSASSKTAFGTALQLRAGGLEVVGLTSRGNLAFCRQLGCYDRVLAYEEVPQLEAEVPSAYIDFSGNGGLREALHTQLRALRHSLAIGYTHVDRLEAEQSQPLPGPPVTVFFAPDRIRQRSAEWGATEFARRLAAAYAGFADFCTRPMAAGEPLLRIERQRGPAEAMAAYLQVLRGGGDPRVGRVASLAGS